MKMLAPLCLAALSALPSRSPALAGGVLIVAADGSGQFTEIQPAIDAAMDGDTILVKGGTYALFSIVNKEITVAADAGHAVQVDGSVQVRNLAAGKDVVLSGLSVTGAAGSQAWSGVGLRLKNDAGSVRVQSCTLGGGLTGGTRYGALVEACSNVAFIDSTLRGWFASSGQPGFDGLFSSGSAVALYDCNVVGRDGESADCFCTGGGNGSTTDTFLFASGSSFSGGDGGSSDAQSLCCPRQQQDGCDGGDGLALFSGEAHVLGSTFQGGFGGLADCCFIAPCGTDGFDGQGVDDPGGSVDMIPGSSRTMTAPAVVRELTAVPLTFHGEPGDVVSVYLARNPDFEFRPTFHGVHLTQVPPQARVLNFGTVPASGVLSSQIAFPDYGPGVESKVFHLQSVFRDANGERFLGSSKTLVVLDQAF